MRAQRRPTLRATLVAAALCSCLLDGATGGTAASARTACGTRTPAQTLRVDVSTRGRQALGRTWRATISADGRVVAFTSSAGNLVPHDTNRRADVFVRDLVTHETVRVSVSSTGAQ